MNEPYIVTNDNLDILARYTDRDDAMTAANAIMGGFVTTHSGYVELFLADLPYLPEGRPTMARKLTPPAVPSVNDRSVRATARRADVLGMLRDGRRNRATTFRPNKGKGSYTRKDKHGGWT